MADREMVIHGLELVKEDICERFTSGSQISIDCLRIDKAIALLKEQEAVVQCKDCKHKEESVSPSWEAWCNRLHCGCDNDWFCADGERKD